MSEGKGRTGYPEILPPQVAKLVGDLDVHWLTIETFFFSEMDFACGKNTQTKKTQNSDIHELFWLLGVGVSLEAVLLLLLLLLLTSQYVTGGGFVATPGATRAFKAQIWEKFVAYLDDPTC